MIIYTGALFWTLLLFIYNKHGLISLAEKQKATRMQAFLSMAYLVFFIGLRSAGADTAAYIRGYTLTIPGWERFFYTLINFREANNFFAAYGVLMKTIFGSNYTPYLFVIAAISGFAITRCIYRYSDGYFTSMILFILWGTWTWMFNGIRQFLAVSILFLCLFMIVENKPIQYIIIVLIASRIHTSALIMIPAFFLVRGEPWKSRTMITVLLTMLAVFFTSSFLDTLETVTEGTEYSGVVTSRYFTEDTGSNPIRTLFFAIPTVLAFIEKESIEQRAPKLIKICVNMSILCVCISAVANVTSGIYVGRIPIYFSLYNLILLPWLFCHTSIGRRSWIMSIMAVFVAYFIYEQYIHGNIYYMSEILKLTII